MMNLDFDMKIYYGDPIEISENVFVYPKTMKDIKDIGEKFYNQLLSVVLLNKEKVAEIYSLSEEGNEFKEQLDDYSFICLLAYKDEMLRDSLSEALSFFINDDVFFNNDILMFCVNHQNPTLINVELFSSIQSIIKKQNYIFEKQQDYKPHNDKAKELLEKMKKVKSKLQKQNQNEGLRLFDVISIVANYSNDINVFKVWDLTVYQLYESYIRILMWDDYHTKFSILPHVTEENKPDIKHWASKTDVKN